MGTLRRLVLGTAIALALGACRFPVEDFAVDDAALGAGDAPGADTTSPSGDARPTLGDAGPDVTTAPDTTGALDTAATPDTVPGPDSAPAPDTTPLDTGRVDDTATPPADTGCTCVEYAGASGHCKRWDPPGCGGS